MALDAFLNVGGLISLSIGALLHLSSSSKGRQARYLENNVRKVDRFGELESLLSVVPVLVAITGRVWCKKPINCLLSEEKGAIVKLREERKSESRTSDIWIPGVEPLREVVKESPWALAQSLETAFLGSESTSRPAEPGNGRHDAVMVPIVSGCEAHGRALQLSGEVFHPSNEGVFQEILGHISGHRNLGIRMTEEYLPNGCTITAIGELAAVIDDPNTTFEGAIRKDGKMYVLQAPKDRGSFILSRNSFPEIIEFYQGAAAFSGTLSTVFLSLGSSMLMTSLYRKVWVWYREQRMKRRVQEARRVYENERKKRKGVVSRIQTPEGNANDKETHFSSRGVGDCTTSSLPKNLCVICLENESKMVYPLCGHLCICKSCATRGNTSSKCPICRSAGKPVVLYTV